MGEYEHCAPCVHCCTARLWFTVADGTGLTTKLKCSVAVEFFRSVIVTVTLKVPDDDGLPDNLPSEFMTIPVGNDDAEKV